MTKKSKQELSARDALLFADAALRKRVLRATHANGDIELTWSLGARVLTLRATSGPLRFVQLEGEHRNEGEVVADRHLYALLDWVR